MRYSAVLGWILLTPGIHHLANKKYLTASAQKHRTCSQAKAPEDQTKEIDPTSLYDKLFVEYAQRKPKQFIHYLSKILI